MLRDSSLDTCRLICTGNRFIATIDERYMALKHTHKHTHHNTTQTQISSTVSE